MLTKIVTKIITTILVLAALFFGAIGIAALATHQDYVTVLLAVFEWIKGLSN